MSTKPPPRLYVLMRPDAERAVVLRQGPSKVFCTLGWDLRSDKVVVGQWCKHKIYVERCDISSTGKYLVYFALDGKWKSEAAGAWTALSLAPYLKALKLWPQGHTWGGGGQFYRDPKRAPASVAAMWNDLEDVDGDRLGFGSITDRLLRDGWLRPTKSGYTKPINKSLTLQIKPLNVGARYAVLGGGDVEARPGWTWADVDAKRKRLLWAEAGVLYGAPIKATGLGTANAIFDARALTFEAIAAPYQNKTIIVGS